MIAKIEIKGARRDMLSQEESRTRRICKILRYGSAAREPALGLYPVNL